MAADLAEPLLEGSFADVTRVQYFDSRDTHRSDEYLNDEQLESKFSEIDDLVQNGDQTPQHVSGTAESNFILITTMGAPKNPELPLQISTRMLRLLINAGFVHVSLGAMYNRNQAHRSLIVEYDLENTTPIALHVSLRTVMLGDTIHCALRIRLKDLACVCLMSAQYTERIEALRRACVQDVNIIRTFPLQMVHSIFEEIAVPLSTWGSNLWKRIRSLEDWTGMTPSRELATARVDLLDSRRLTILLRDLHAVRVELRIGLINIKTMTGFIPWVITALEKLEKLRAEVGASALTAGQRAQFEDLLRFNENILPNMVESTTGFLDCIDGQMNVTSSMIAQKSNEQNYQIAKLTAADSRTMKAITVLTLTFLPGTMLASLWDAGIFTLAKERSWKVYVGTTCGLTMIVFAVWYVYVKVATRETLVSAAGIEEFEDGSDEEKRFMTS